MEVLCLFVLRRLLFHCQNVFDDPEPSKDGLRSSLLAGWVPSKSPILILNQISVRLALWVPLGCHIKYNYADNNMSSEDSPTHTHTRGEQSAWRTPLQCRLRLIDMFFLYLTPWTPVPAGLLYSYTNNKAVPFKQFLLIPLLLHHWLICMSV